MDRVLIALGAVAGLIAVGMAALAAHSKLDPAALAMLHSALQIHGWHALALLFTGVWAGRGGRLASLAGIAFAAGTLLFCGDVYALALTGVHLAPAAPVGGSLLMLGWALLGASALLRQ